MSDKIEEIRITLALNPKQIAERMLSGEVNSESHFVSQQDHLHVASLVDAAHREIVKLRAENERLRADRRERIATAALQGILACQEGNTALPKEWPGIFAIMSVGCADALIAELDKEGKP